MSKPCNHDSHADYEILIEPIREAARERGYAIAVHGTLIRDIDLIAVPWTNRATDPFTLVEAIIHVVAEKSPKKLAFLSPHETSDYFKAGCPGGKPHRRLQ